MRIKNYLWEVYWKIGIVDHPIEEVLTDPDFLNDVHIIKTPDDYFLADPFEDLSNTNAIICEQFNFPTQTGSVVRLKLDEQNNISKVEEIFNDGLHRSFPFMDIINDQKFILPEYGEQGSLEIYSYPDLNLFNTIPYPIIDPVIFEHDSKYWMFCTLFDGTELEKLHLFYTDDLKGEWTKHPQNNLCDSLRGARMAGKILVKEGKLYRFGQDSSSGYGDGIVIFEIERLTENEYQEKEVGYLFPPEGTKGIHTLNPFGNKTLIDARFKKFSAKKPVQRLKRKLS